MLWPHRSLSARGFVWFFGGSAAFVALPLLAVLGTPILWGLLPFFLVTFWGLWAAIRANSSARSIREELTLDKTHARLFRQDPNREDRSWETNRHWVTVHLHPNDGPVENYITLRGGPREVEIGAFLDPEERRRLSVELKDAIRGTGRR